jgi:hypothetical protein
MICIRQGPYNQLNYFFSLSSILYIIILCYYLNCTININVYCLKFHKLCWDSMINTQVDIVEHVCVGVN